MNNRHWVVFGAGTRPNKAVIGYKSPRINGYEVKICEIVPAYKYGDEIDLEDITGEYITLMFAKEESLSYFIDTLQTILAEWKGETK